MNLQTVVLTGASALTANGSEQALHTPVIVNGRNVFRRVFGLRINTGGLANRIRFAADNAHLSLAFEPDEYDIRGTPAATVTSKGSQALVIELPAPMRVTGARFTGVTNASTIDVHRLDGDELVEDPTKSFANDGTVSGDFTDLRFALRLRKTDASLANIGASNLADVDVKGFPTAARVGLTRAGNDPSSAFFFWIVPGEVGKQSDSPTGSADIGALLADAIQQEIDVLEPPYPPQLDFLLVFESDAPCQFRANSFVIPFGLMRSSFRGVLLRKEDVSDSSAFAVHLRDAATPLTQYLRGKLAAATRNTIDRVERSVPERTIALVLKDLNQAMQTEAFYSAPRFQGITLTPETLAAAIAAPSGVQRTRVNRALLAEAFPGTIAPIAEPTDDEKEVLDAQGASSTLAVLVDVPRTATIRSATVRLEGDLKGDAPANSANGSSSTGAMPAWDDPIPDHNALTVDANRAIARRIEPAAAVDASGIALALACTSLSSELTAELREDQDGTPAGRTMASAAVLVDRLDKPAWIHFPFRSPVVVQATSYWIVLRAAAGSALWFAIEQEATTRAGNAAQGWTDSGGFTHIAPLYHLWRRAANGLASAGSGNADLANRLRVTIGNTTVSPVLGQTGRARTVNIALALQQWLTTQPGPVAIVAAPIRVAALGKGSVTVYPPEVEYDV